MGWIVSILIAQSAGAIGSVFTVKGVKDWYPLLVKPSWNPPSWLFGPVWISLYTLMGIAAYLVYKKKNKKNKRLIGIYGVHLLFNSLWSGLFFGMQRIDLALVEIVVLWLLIGYLSLEFFKTDKRAGYLMLPYWLWVSFAGYLNYTIWGLNV